MADIKPFTISIPDNDLADLKTRLSLAKFPQNDLDGAGWDYGSPLADIKRITAHWKDKYDWREAEATLNKLPHFLTTIQCTGFEPLQIHFLHQPSTRKNAIPLLFVHGWPGSFLEATKVIDDLSSPASSDEPAFHVVALSLPNYGFSGGSTKKGFSLSQYAETAHKLMLQLGYNEYITQGGDWGYMITRALALKYPKHVKATHVNMDHGNPPTLTSSPLAALSHALTPYTEAEKRGLARTKWFHDEGSGYGREHCTKPHTLGFAFADSPVALLAWIYEKLHDWTDGYPWTDDEVCTWLSIYWFSTAGPAASIRIYYESVHKWDDPETRVTRDQLTGYIGGVKLGLTHSPQEIYVLPKAWTATQGEVVFEKTWDDGGHFYAWEKPQHLLEDLRAMFGRRGGAEGCVKGKNGF